MIGKTISHYKIIEKLGEGGMGVVYKAQDTKLKRTVALKFLPQELLCDSEAKARFAHEAQAASALNHPNITTIHEIDEVEGKCFISMEYIEGKSIKELIKEKESSIGKVLQIAIQIAEGLNAAHKKDIVHRDIKSDNIMVTDEGLVKIMDFGLAKLKGATKLTKTGCILGTFQYMSPEQVSREAADFRSDIFSFGVVLYEMITGQLPFKGEQEAAVLHSILNETPEPLAIYNNEVSPELERIVSKALAKEKKKRYQRIDDVLVDLVSCKERKASVTDSPERMWEQKKSSQNLDELLEIAKMFKLKVERDRYFNKLIDLALKQDEPEKATKIAAMLDLTVEQDKAYWKILRYYILKKDLASAKALVPKFSLQVEQDKAAEEIFSAFSKGE